MSELTHEDVRRILQIIDEMGDRDVHLEFGDLKLHVTRGDGSALPLSRPAEQVSAPAAAPPAQSNAPAPKAQAQWDVPAGLVAVRAPSAGTFYRAASPGAKPFVEVGTRVRADDIVCVFDVMKLFNSLKAGVAGTISHILVENEALLQQDQPMILIQPD